VIQSLAITLLSLCCQVGYNRDEPSQSHNSSTPDLKVAKDYFDHGNAWVGKGEHDKAIEDFNEAIRLDPKVGAAYTYRALAWLEKGEHDKDMPDLVRARSSDTDFRFGWINALSWPSPFASAYQSIPSCW
jgi:tetratricopeptide (TPR) repeat protein